MQVRLSETSSVAIKIPLKGRDGQPVQAVLSQQEFERLSADLFRRARLPLDEACWQVCPRWLFSPTCASPPCRNPRYRPLAATPSRKVPLQQLPLQQPLLL